MMNNRHISRWMALERLIGRSNPMTRSKARESRLGKNCAHPDLRTMVRMPVSRLLRRVAFALATVAFCYAPFRLAALEAQSPIPKDSILEWTRLPEWGVAQFGPAIRARILADRGALAVYDSLLSGTKRTSTRWDPYAALWWLAESGGKLPRQVDAG